MANKSILSIDQGTTSSRALLVNSESGEPILKFNQEFSQLYPRPGWVEHNPEDIWNSVRAVVLKIQKEAYKNSKYFKENGIGLIGLTNQRETVVLWNKKTGRPIYNAIVWQCRRTQDYCDSLKKNKFEKWIHKKTGLLIDPYFSASKIRWMLKNIKGAAKAAKNGELACGTIDSFLLWKLSGGSAFKTDVSNASRTMLMDISTGEWDSELLDFFEIPRKLLPDICDSAGTFAYTKNLDFLPDGIPITGVAGDQQAALFGQCGFKKADVKCTFGTGSFILLNTGKEKIDSKNKLLTTVAWRLPGEKITYALEGGAFVCGAAVQWLRDGLQIISKSSDIEKLAREVSSSEGVEVIPAFVGLGAPYWWPEARALISGLTRGTQRSHIAYATLESMAFQNTDILKAMEKDLKGKIKKIKVDGGACANNLLMQMQANSMGSQVIRPKMIETTSMGAAYLAGLGFGYWSSTKDIEKLWKVDQVFDVEISSQEQKERLTSWHKAVQMLRP